MLSTGESPEVCIDYQLGRKLEQQHKAYIPAHDCVVHSAKSHEVWRLLQCMQRPDVDHHTLVDAVRRAREAVSSDAERMQIILANKRGLTVQVSNDCLSVPSDTLFPPALEHVGTFALRKSMLCAAAAALFASPSNLQTAMCCKCREQTADKKSVHLRHCTGSLCYLISLTGCKNAWQLLPRNAVIKATCPSVRMSRDLASGQKMHKINQSAGSCCSPCRLTCCRLPKDRPATSQTKSGANPFLKQTAARFGMPS